MRNFLAAAVFILVLILFFQNLDEASVRLLFWQFKFSIGFWILCAFLSGLLLGYLLGFFGRSKKQVDEKSSDLENEDEEFLRPE